VLEIPQFGTKHSLNVAVAAGIVLWEVTRKLTRVRQDGKTDLNG
jgi:tRNA G18 (ribose-2'-O)-methylase SpoU